MTGALFAFALLLNAGPVAAQAAPDPVKLSTSTMALPDGKVITVEVATTQADRKTGLMNRTSLPADWGMLFVYDRDAIRQFWMKNTWMDLDIIFLDAKGRITRVVQRVPRSYADTPDEKVARVTGWGKYVLELPAGGAAKYGLKNGQVCSAPGSDRRDHQRP